MQSLVLIRSTPYFSCVTLNKKRERERESKKLVRSTVAVRLQGWNWGRLARMTSTTGLRPFPSISNRPSDWPCFSSHGERKEEKKGYPHAPPRKQRRSRQRAQRYMPVRFARFPIIKLQVRIMQRLLALGAIVLPPLWYITFGDRQLLQSVGQIKASP